MAKERITTWYVGTTDSHTNKVISMHDSEKTQIGIIKGITEELWECTYSLIEYMVHSKVDLCLKFTVYSKKGKNGPINKNDFLFRKNKIDLKLKNKL